MADDSARGIRIEGLSKRYGSGDTAVDALRKVDMTVAPGEVVGLIGPSGSGKSTLLKCLGAVIDPSAGRMTLGGERIYDDGWRTLDLRALRRDKIGFVFQAPYLIPFLDVTDNVALPRMLAGHGNADARQQAVDGKDVTALEGNQQFQQARRRRRHRQQRLLFERQTHGQSRPRDQSLSALPGTGRHRPVQRLPSPRSHDAEGV